MISADELYPTGVPLSSLLDAVSGYADIDASTAPPSNDFLIVFDDDVPAGSLHHVGDPDAPPEPAGAARSGIEWTPPPDPTPLAATPSDASPPG